MSKAKPGGMLVPAVTPTRLAPCLPPLCIQKQPNTRKARPCLVEEASFLCCYLSLLLSCWFLSPRGSERFSNDLQVRRRESSINMHTVKVTKEARTHTRAHTHARACSHILPFLRDNWVIGGEPPHLSILSPLKPAPYLWSYMT